MQIIVSHSLWIRQRGDVNGIKYNPLCNVRLYKTGGEGGQTLSITAILILMCYVTSWLN